MQEFWSPSEEDKKAVDILRSLGYSVGEAKTMVYFLNFNEAESRHIEGIMKASQPEISVALSMLVKEDCLNCREVKREVGKGRPVKHYNIKNKGDILKFVVEDSDKKIKRQTDLIEELKRLATQISNQQNTY